MTDSQRRALKIFELWLDDRCPPPASPRELMAVMLGYLVDQTDGRPNRCEAALMTALKTAMDAQSEPSGV